MNHCGAGFSLRGTSVPLGLVLAAGLFCEPVPAVEPSRVTGLIAGRVMDSAGIPQMGAAVLLFNRYERLVSRALTNERGGFQFESLLPDIYSVRVSLSSFMPALKRNIAVQPGMRSFLAINLTSMLSSIELVYMAPGQAAIMSEDWKWTLRANTATRPVLRLLPGIDITDPASRARRLASSIFSDTRGLLRVANGDTSGLNSLGNQTDLGTAFALATSVFGANQVSVSGNVGYASHTGIPTAGFRTSFSRDPTGEGLSPQVNVTMRQMFLPTRIGAALVAGQGDVPVLQTLAVTLVDRRLIANDLLLEYGAQLESVSFLNRLNHVSPFARLSWGSDKEGALVFAYSSGTPATELLHAPELTDAQLQHQLNALSLFPRLTLRDGRAHVQRTENFEGGYRRSVGSRTFSASAYHESTANAALNASFPGGAIASSDLLPDLASNTSVFNAGRFRRMGYSANFTQHLGDGLSATLGYGYGGALWAGSEDLLTNDANELRERFRRTWRHSASARVAGTAPGTHTRYAASYQFTDYKVLHPVHLSLVERATLEPGLNLYLRQPIPRVGVVHGRLEASAELRNVLAQGYLPVATPGGTRLLLIQSPRAVRGGLSLIF